MRDKTLKTSCKKKSSLGFIFSTDALLSVLIVFFFVGAIAYFSAQTYADYSLLDLERKASDTLAILHKQGYLADQNSTLITSVIEGITGDNVGWQLEVKYYQQSGQNFVLNKTLILGLQNLKLL
jgi:hypothetical protein